MKLFQQLCYCRNKKIEIRRSCEILKAKILTFLLLFILVVEIVVFILLLCTNNSIETASCEHTHEYKNTHNSCIDLRNRIVSAKELADYHSSSIKEYANKITEELEDDLKQKIQTFQELKNEQKICVLKYIRVNNIEGKANFWNKFLWLNLGLYFFAFWWMCRPVKILHVNVWPDIPDDLSSLAFVFTTPLKIVSLFAIILSYGLSNIENLDRFLLNC